MRYFLCCLVIVFINSCGIFENKPDKRVEVVVKVVNPSELKIAKKALQNRLIDKGALISLTPSGNDELKIIIETGLEAKIIKQEITDRANLEFYPVVPNKVIRVDLGEALLAKDSLINSFNTIFSFAKFDYIPEVGYAIPSDSTAVIDFLKTNLSESFNNRLGKEYIFKWGIEDDNGLVALYLLALDSDLKPAMHGDLLLEASQGKGVLGNETISITMNPKAAKEWEILTGNAFKDNTQIAIVVNGKVYSAPGIVSGPIKGGRSEISADFTLEEAQSIANKLSLGYIPELEMVSFNSTPLE